MSNTPQCEYCRAIFEEFMNAWFAIGASQKLKNELRASGQPWVEMIQGTREREDCVEELLARFPFHPQLPGSPSEDSECRYPKIRDAYRKMCEHRLRTGHRALPWN